MRVVVAGIGALVTLGLAGVGVVAGQKAAGPSSIIALAARVISPGQNTAAAPPASQSAQPQAVQPRVAQAPVVQLAQAGSGAPNGASEVAAAPTSATRSATGSPAPTAPAAAAANNPA